MRLNTNAMTKRCSEGIVAAIVVAALAGCSGVTSGNPPAAAGSSAPMAPATTGSNNHNDGTSDSGSGLAGGPVPAGFRPASVTFASPQVGWVLGTAPCPQSICTSMVRTRDGGRSWQGVPAPVAPLSHASTPGGGVKSVRFADQRNGWAFGPDLWATHDGGATWHRVNLPSAQATVTRLEAVAGVAWMVEDTGGAASGPSVLMRASVDSDHFTAVPDVTLPSASASLAADGSTLWVIGGGKLFTGGFGTSFSALSDPCAAAKQGSPEAEDIAAFNGGHVLVACGDNPGLGQEDKQAFESGDAGRSFTAAGNPPSSGDLNGVGTNGDGLFVAAASGATSISASFDNGQTWSDVYDDTANGGLPLVDLGFTTASQGVAVEGAPDSGTGGGMLLQTRDGGRTWHSVSIAAR